MVYPLKECYFDITHKTLIITFQFSEVREQEEISRERNLCQKMPWIPRNLIFMGEPKSLAAHTSTVQKAMRAENKQVFKSGMSIWGKATTDK